MFDYAQFRNKDKTVAELTAHLTVDDLRRETNLMADKVLELIADAVDADVDFEPYDPEANDTMADPGQKVDLAWNLGHLIVHATASNEEYAFIAAEMARGVKREGRSRYETAWETMHTKQQCIDRIEESRRMCLATLDVWPDEPHYSITSEVSWMNGPFDARGRYLLGLGHNASHLAQIADVAAQAKAARSG